MVNPQKQLNNKMNNPLESGCVRPSHFFGPNSGWKIKTDCIIMDVLQGAWRLAAFVLRRWDLSVLAPKNMSTYM